LFDSSLAEHDYTTTVALLAMAFVFIPALVVVSQPLSALLAAAAVGVSVLCAVLAWFHWKRSAKISVPAIGTKDGTAK
jgi:hypothetical protein